MQMLPVALFGPCMLTVPMATHGSSRRAVAYCGSRLRLRGTTEPITAEHYSHVHSIHGTVCCWRDVTADLRMGPDTFAHHYLSCDVEAVYC